MSQGIYPVRLPFVLPVSAERSVDRFVYSYLVLGEQICVVDTGAAGCQGRIVDALAELGRSPADVAWIVNTHAHPDHVGGNVFFRDLAHPRVACHVDDARWIEDLEAQYRERPIYGFFTITGRDPVRVTDKLQDGDAIDLGAGMSLEVVWTPGHSPGSIALFCPREGTLITADTIPPTGGLPLYSDVGRLRDSLKRLLSLDGVAKMYASHTDRPYEGEDVGAALRAGLDYLDRMDQAVADVLHELPPDAEPARITHQVLLRMGFEAPHVIPIVVASVMAHVA